VKHIARVSVERTITFNFNWKTACMYVGISRTPRLTLTCHVTFHRRTSLMESCPLTSAGAGITTHTTPRRF